MGLFQVGKPLTYKDDVNNLNEIKNVAFDSETAVVDRIFLHDEAKIKLNG